MLDYIYLAYVIAGIVVGIFIGMLGIGGGALMTPILIFIFKIPPSSAIAIDLIYAFVTKLFATLLHHNSNGVEKCVIKFVGASGALGSILGVFLFSFLNNYHSDMFDTAIKLAVGAILTISSLLSILLMRLNKTNSTGNKENSTACTKINTISMIISGFIIGTVVSITSIGSGAIITVLLLYVWHVPVKKVVGTSLAIAIIIIGISSLTHAFAGNINILISVFLIIGGIIGVFIGEHIHSKVAEQTLKLIFTVVLMFLGLLLLIKSV